MPPNWMSTRETAYHLVDNSLENRRGNICRLSTIVYKWLNISFCKHSTSRSNRINHRMFFSRFIKALRISMKKNSHLVDKCSSSTSTSSIHSLLDSRLKKCDFSVFSAKLNSYICHRNYRFDGFTAGNYLLLEFNTKNLSQCHAT